MRARLAWLGVATLLLAGCEGLFTGAEVMRAPLQQNADGSFAPVSVQLVSDMNPIALNLHGETMASVQESGRWNSYAATLTRNGVVVASGRFNINNTGAAEAPHGGAFQLTMLQVSIAEGGEYELTVAPTKPREITVNATQLVVRRNSELIAR